MTKLHLSPKPVTVTFVSFAVSGITSIQRRIQEFAMGEADPGFQFGGAHGERGNASL